MAYDITLLRGLPPLSLLPLVPRSLLYPISVVLRMFGGSFPSPHVPPLDWQLLLPMVVASSCPFVLASLVVRVALVPLLVVVVVISGDLLASWLVFLYLAPSGPVCVGFPG